MSSPVWLITGASIGLGLALTKSAAAVERIEKAGGSVVEMDMTESKASITSKVQAVSRIDYLVNNAGYSILAACEEMTDKDATLQININFFGPLTHSRPPSPQCELRSLAPLSKSPVSPLGTHWPRALCMLCPLPGQAALEAASESLAKELAPHSIRVLIVEPGNFRTNSVSASSVQLNPALPLTTIPSLPYCTGIEQLANASPEPAAVPAHYDDPVGVIMRKFLIVHGKQIGDPDKAVESIFEAVTGGGLAGHLAGNVLRLVLGKNAPSRMKVHNDKFLHELSLQEETVSGTDFTS